MAFDQRFLDELIARNDIVDVVGRYVTLTQRGGEYWGCCPFHSEKTPSFHVRPEQQMYHCFGCKKGGGVINFIMDIENLSFPDAVYFLAKQVNLPVPEQTRNDEGNRLRTRLLALNRDAARYFYEQLQSDAGSAVRRYLEKRKITRRNAMNFGLGAAPESWDALFTEMTRRGYTRSELLAAGLAVQGKSGGLYDKFRNRLMFPIIDVRGDVLGFGGRVVDPEDKGAKYMNTPETIVYSKRRVLYGLNLARKSKRSNIILVEGNIDVVMLHQAGFDNACASMGTALTPEQLHLLSRYTKELVLCYDNDEAGRAATQKALTLLGDTEFEVRVLELPQRLVDGQYVKQDADDFIKNQGREAFENLLSGSESGMEFRLSRLVSQFDLKSDRGRIEFSAAAAEVLAGLPNAVEREVYTARAADMAGVPVQALGQEVDRALSRQNRKARRARERKELNVIAARQPQERSLRYENPRSASAEEGVLRLLALCDEVFPEESPLRQEEFSSPVLGRLFAALWQQRKETGRISPAALGEEFSPEEISLLSGVLQQPTPRDAARQEQALRDYLGIIKEEARKRDGTGTDALAEVVEKYKKKGHGGTRHG